MLNLFNIELHYRGKKTLFSKLGLTQWNQNSFEFKFDDTRLSSWYQNKIAQLNFFLSVPDVAKSLPCWQPTRQRLSNVRAQQKTKIQLGQSYCYIMRKVWYHQIWIQNYLGFIVSDLMSGLVCLQIACLWNWLSKSYLWSYFK